MRLLPISVAAVLLVFGVAPAEIPQVMGYQGRITDNAGNPVGDGNWPMRFRIYDAQSGGSLLWDSGAQSVAVAGGVFNVMLGESPHPTLGLSFDQDCWLLVTFDGEDQSPRRRLGSVGYAYMASGLVPGTVVSGSVPGVPTLEAMNTATTGYAAGLRGETASTQGDGVFGQANATSGSAAFGGRFVTHSSSGVAVRGVANATSGTAAGGSFQSSAPSGIGVRGTATDTGGTNYGVLGETSSSNSAAGVYGIATATAGHCYGVYGTSSSYYGAGVVGVMAGYSPATMAAPTGGYFGCDTYGLTAETNDGLAVRGVAYGTVGSNYAIHGTSYSNSGTGVLGMALATTGTNWGVYGLTTSSSGYGVVGDSQYGTAVYGVAFGSTGLNVGVRGETNSNAGWGVYGYADATVGNSVAVRGKCESAAAYAGYFVGDVYVSGSINKSACSFLIDHPLDPENKLLRHNCMESPEHLVVYRGKVRLSADGEAIVEMPAYFQALTAEDEATVNLTPIGRPAASAPRELSYEWTEGFGGFRVFGEPFREVAWTALAERDDPTIRRLRRPVEENKGLDNKYCDRGKLLQPVAYGYPETVGQDYDSDRDRTDHRRRQLERRRQELVEAQRPTPSSNPAVE